MGKYLEQVNSPSDLKKLSVAELGIYADEVREYIIETVLRRGGHLSSNLGSVELTVALHYAFNAPDDKLLFDVGHQSYTHKIITGRREAFAGLRTDDGVSGFPNVSESVYDAFTMGHSSTSLSVGIGIARGERLAGRACNVVSVIGDGAFTGGMAFEALNDIGANKEKLIIILNDNKMSISKNVGGFSQYLARLRLSKGYSKIKHTVKGGVKALPFFGDALVRVLDKAKDDVKLSLINGKIFENLGVKYYGPVDGHNIEGLIDMLNRLKTVNGPVLLHVVTKKGCGMREAELCPEKYHGVGGEHSTVKKAYSAVVEKELCTLAADNKEIVAVTAAMSGGTGLEQFSKKYPKRFYDVGIAEGHAVTMCAGLAATGAKPYFAVYSSFLQRAYDQIMHDVCIDRRPVTFLIDHAGIVEGDGATHQGIYDIAFLSSLPGVTILQPKNGAELKKMLGFSVSFNGPLFIRYEKAYEDKFGESKFTSLDWEYIKTAGSGVVILAAGNRMLSLADKLENVTLLNARVIKPLDCKLLDELRESRLIVTLEDGAVRGGFGDAVRDYYNGDGPRVISFGYNDAFHAYCSEEKMLASAGITVEKIKEVIKKYTHFLA